MTAKNTSSGERGHARPRGVQNRADRRTSPKGSTVCEECGLFFRAGRWQHGVPPLGDESTGLCPACERIRNGEPAGTIRVHGDVAGLEEELGNMARNLESAESGSHPLERLMDVGPEDGVWTVNTTGLHLARRVANALERRLHRKGVFKYSDGEERLIVDLE